jgi:hypothetical protein
MRVNSPLLLLKCNEDYTILYFTTEINNGEPKEPIVRIFVSSVPSESVKEYYLKNNLTIGEILYYFRHTAGEDEEVNPEDLHILFSGCKILSIIP